MMMCMSTQINAYLDPSDVDQIDGIANDLGLSRSSVIRMLIREALRHREDQS